jgi:predicted transcriptional regulator
MNKKIKAVLFTLFAVLVLCAFNYYSLLRPAAYGALYKESITAIFVISICFLNYFVLFPILYKKRKFLLYAVSTFFSVLITAIAEEVLVYPQVSEIFSPIGDLTLHEYTIFLTFILLIRNLCFVSLFLLVSLLEDSIRENKEINDSVKKINNLIIAKCENGENKSKMITIPINDIVYCQQEENYTYIFTTAGNKYNRNCSLSSFAKELGNQLVVRISRGVIVFYKHVHSFDENNVYVAFMDKEKPIGFLISNAYKENAMRLLKKNTTPRPHHVNELLPNPEQTQGIEETIQISNEMESACQTEERNNIQFVLDYINGHPDCKGTDIVQFCRLSLSTVNRILKQLRDEGLIEYSGSKKTGGYRVKL